MTPPEINTMRRVDQLETAFERLLPPSQSDGSGEALGHLEGNILAPAEDGRDRPRGLEAVGGPAGGRRSGSSSSSSGAETGPGSPGPDLYRAPHVVRPRSGGQTAAATILPTCEV